MRKKLAATAVAATRYRTELTLQKIFGFGIKRFFYSMRKKLAAIAMTATGFNQPSMRLLGWELNGFFIS